MKLALLPFLCSIVSLTLAILEGFPEAYLYGTASLVCFVGGLVILSMVGRV